MCYSCTKNEAICYGTAQIIHSTSHGHHMTKAYIYVIDAESGFDTYIHFIQIEDMEIVEFKNHDNDSVVLRYQAI